MKDDYLGRTLNGELVQDDMMDDPAVRHAAMQRDLHYSTGDINEHAQRVLAHTELTAQERRFSAFLRQGLPFEVACNAAGLSRTRGIELRDTNEVIAQSTQHNYRLQAGKPLVTTDMLTLMLFEERERSATASEGIAAIREMGRLNGLYPEQQKLAPHRGGVSAGVTVNGQSSEAPEMSRNALARKSDDELFALAVAKVYNSDADAVQYDKEPADYDEDEDDEEAED